MEVKELEFSEDITVFYVQADKFPEGIPASFEKLGDIIGGFKNRHMYGVTICVDNVLIFRAAIKEEFKGEGEKFNLKTYDIPKGKYLYTILNNWKQNIPQMPAIFDQLMKLPDVKKQTVTVEDYTSETQMLAMVQLDK